MKKPSSTPKLYTVNGLSEQTGVDRRTIKKRLRDVPPRKMEGVSALYALEDLPLEPAGDAASLKDEKLSEEIRKLRIKNDKDEGKLVPRVEVASAIRRALSQAAGISEQKLVQEYPSCVPGLDVPQARVYGRRLHDSLMEEFQKLAKEFPE